MRRVNKTHATGGVPPLPLPRLPRDARRGTQGAALLPQVLGSPHSPWFFFFFFWGKTGERHDLHYLLDTIILNQTEQLLIQPPVILLHRCTLVCALPAHALALSLALCRCRVPLDPRGPQSTTPTNAAGGARQVKGRRVTSFFCGGERGRAAPADGIRLLSSAFCTRNKGRERARGQVCIYKLFKTGRKNI